MDCKYVNSFDLHFIANVKGPFLSDSEYFMFKDYTGIYDNSCINVCPQGLPMFVKYILPKIKVPFKLITNNSDKTLPDDYPTESNVILESPFLKHWYSQNFILDHPKVTRIPIGLDYHSLKPYQTKFRWLASVPQQHYLGIKKSPIDQELELLVIRNNSKPFWERQIKAYANFQFLMNKGYAKVDRVDAFNTIPKDVVFYQPTKTTRNICWNNMIQYAFVISPHGNGLDCHRTWEALALGCIPVVKSSGIDPLFEELPVWIVKDWNEVTLDNIKRVIESFKLKSFNYEKLTTEYWKSKIMNT
jgi:hypothetical protein